MKKTLLVALVLASMAGRLDWPLPASRMPRGPSLQEALRPPARDMAR